MSGESIWSVFGICINGVNGVYAYLTMSSGARAGAHFILQVDRDTRIGRGIDCDVVLSDPLCSRVHAVVFHRDEGWWLRDAGSRNGTFVNGQKIDQARLVEGVQMRVGSVEFSFHQDAQGPADLGDVELTQTIVRDTPMRSRDTDTFSAETFRGADKGQNLVKLYQLSLGLLGVNEPDDVAQQCLELLQDVTNATLVGFLWLNDEGQLKPKLVLPNEDGKSVKLSDMLTEMVCKKRRAVWVDDKTSATNTSDSLRNFANAICVPLIHDDKTTVGAIHVYLDKGNFKTSDFDFAISVANIMVVALVRARQQALLQTNHRRLVDKVAGFDELIGESKPMLDLKSKISRIARATGCVLIRGESGAGKELVARGVHRASSRADRPMLSVNCAAIPRDLMESQLFGHHKGAFTGADSDHVGYFAQADSGTLFLDEVGEMTLEGQAKLLRILEGHPFMPVGSSKEVTADVRVIAATNRDLREFVREGKFREDLYYRLSVFELYIPPLRERGEDIERLVTFFLDHFKMQHGRPTLALSPEARAKLLQYNWPGNVRQLRNVIDSAVVMAEGEFIHPEDLGLRDVGGGDVLASLRIDDWERKLIKEALARTGNNVPESAKLLGIGRATLYRKIDEYGIQR